MALTLLTAIAAAIASDGATERIFFSSLGVRVVPCADNSFRVLVAPSQVSPAVEKSLESLKATLAREGLAELPGAFVGCEMSSATVLTDAAPTATHGNLEIKLSPEGELTFTRLDTGTVYAKASPSIEAPAPLENSCEVGDFAAGADVRVASVTLAEAARWCTANATCAGFTTRADGEGTCAALGEIQDEQKEVYFKAAGAGLGDDPTWRVGSEHPHGRTVRGQRTAAATKSRPSPNT